MEFLNATLNKHRFLHCRWCVSGQDGSGGSGNEGHDRWQENRLPDGTCPEQSQKTQEGKLGGGVLRKRCRRSESMKRYLFQLLLLSLVLVMFCMWMTGRFQGLLHSKHWVLPAGYIVALQSIFLVTSLSVPHYLHNFFTVSSSHHDFIFYSDFFKNLNNKTITTTTYYYYY